MSNPFADIQKSNFYRWYLNNKYNLKGTVNKIGTVDQGRQILRELPKIGTDQMNLFTNRAIKGTKKTLTLEELRDRVIERIADRMEELRNQKPIVALSFDYTAEFYRYNSKKNAVNPKPIIWTNHYEIDLYPEDNSTAEKTIKRYLEKNSMKNPLAFSNEVSEYTDMNRDIREKYFSGNSGGLVYEPKPKLLKVSNIKYKVWKKVSKKDLDKIKDHYNSGLTGAFGSHKKIDGKNIFMKGEVYTIDGFDIDTVSLQSTGFCVPDYLIHRYGHVRGFIKHCRNRQTMAEYFGYDSVEDMYQVGISTEQLIEFAKDHKINLRAFDINLNPISILSDYGHVKNRPLVYIRVYEHMLGIEQGSELCKHLNHKYTASNIKAPQSKIKKEETFNPFTLPILTMLNADPREILIEKDCLVLTNHLNRFLEYLIKEKHKIPFKNNLVFEGTHVIQIKIPKQNLYIMEAGSHKTDKELYDRLGLEYKGHGKSGLVKAIFNQEHVKDSNKEPIPEENRKIVLAYGSCVYCDSSNDLTVDHIKPRKLGGTNDLDNLQCLCKTCNSSKKAKYNRFDEIQSDLLTEDLETIFTKYAHNEQFYLLQPIKKRTVSIDINRSYPAGLTENIEPWCIFDATCQPVEFKRFDKDKRGLYYIRFNNRIEEAKIFFRCTDGWFYRHTVEQLLHWGFNLSIFYYLAPSKTFKSTYFKDFINELFDLFNVDDAKNLARVFSGVLRQWKSVVTSKNHTIGSRLECLVEAQKLNQNGEIPFIRNLTDDVYMLFDMSHKINQINCLPIGHQMLENSMMNLYNVYHTLDLKLSDLYMINVDEIVFKKYRNIQSIQTPNDTIVFSREITRDKSYQCINKHKHSNKCFPIISEKITGSSVKVVIGNLKIEEVDTFRKVNLTEILKNTNPFGGYKIKDSVNLKRFTQGSNIVPTPVDTEPKELYYYQPKKWKHIEKDVVTDEYIKENNIIIDGLAGTGKSTLGRSLTENGDWNKLAFTNKAALNINGKTFHKFFGLDCRNRIKMDWTKIKSMKSLMIDEFSMIPYEIWRILLVLKKNRPEVKFMLLGDWNQIPSVEDRSVDYSNLDFVKELVDCKMLQLTENKRSNGSMFDIYKRLIETNEMDVDQFGKNENTMIHLVYTNKKRIELNGIHNQKHYHLVQPEKFVKIKKHSSGESKQDMIIFEGVPLIATRTFEVNKEHIVNNETFMVNGISGENIIIGNESHELTFSQKELYHNFLLAYSTTVHKAQGATIREEYTIHQWGLMNTKLRYTAVSRTTRKEDVNILID